MRRDRDLSIVGAVTHLSDLLLLVLLVTVDAHVDVVFVVDAHDDRWFRDSAGDARARMRSVTSV